jgi:hypothetical protein
MDMTRLMSGQPAPPVLPGEWTFYADRLETSPASGGLGPPSGVLQLGPVQLARFHYHRDLSAFGAGEAEILVGTSSLTRTDLLRLWGWRLWCYYEGTPVFCGWPTGLTDAGGASVTVTLTEVTGFLTKRQFATTARHSQTEQVDIARQLAQPLQEVGVEVVTDAGPGFLRDRSYTYLENSRAELLTNLSNVISGPQFRTDYYMGTDGLPHARLTIAYPRVGSDIPDLGVTVPGGVIDYSAKWDSDLMRTMTFAVGDTPEDAPEDTPKPVYQLHRPQPSTGIPIRLDEADDWPGTILMATLADRANSYADMYAAPSLVLDATVPLDKPSVATYGPGDGVTIHIADPLLEGGLDVHGQLTQAQINAAEGTAIWTVSTELPPPRPRETLVQTLHRLDWTTTGLFRRNLVVPPSPPDGS